MPGLSLSVAQSSCYASRQSSGTLQELGTWPALQMIHLGVMVVLRARAAGNNEINENLKMCALIDFGDLLGYQWKIC